MIFKPGLNESYPFTLFSFLPSPTAQHFHMSGCPGQYLSQMGRPALWMLMQNQSSERKPQRLERSSLWAACQKCKPLYSSYTSTFLFRYQGKALERVIFQNPLKYSIKFHKIICMQVHRTNWSLIQDTLE